MPNVNLAALSAAELRRTLDSSRARGDAALAYEVLREMAARREGGGRGRRRGGAPHLVSVDLSDPMDRVDDEAEDAEAAPRAPEPLTLRIPDPEPLTGTAAEADWSLSLHREAPPPRPARPRRGVGGIAGFALGIMCGVGLGWFAAGRIELPGGPVAAAFASAAPEAAPSPAPPQALAEAPTEAAPEAQPEMLEVSVAEPAPQAAEPPPAADACAAETTPADRAICGDPALLDLQRELRQAYAEALDAHQDKDTLRQRQLAWRDARSEVADAEALAGLYRERIARLRGATSAARAGR